MTKYEWKIWAIGGWLVAVGLFFIIVLAPTYTDRVKYVRLTTRCESLIQIAQDAERNNRNLLTLNKLFIKYGVKPVPPIVIPANWLDYGCPK